MATSQNSPRQTKVVIRSVRDSILSEVQHRPGEELIQRLLDKGAGVYLFAGAVRDAVAKRECGWAVTQTRDWDVGISQIPRSEFVGIMREVGGVRNKYGGYKLLNMGYCPWDVWRLEDTTGLRKTGSPFSLENTLRSFVLSCNALAFDFDSARIVDHGALRAIQDRKISVLKDAILHDLNIFSAKAIWLSARLSFTLNKESRSFVARNLRMKELYHEALKTYSNLSLCDNLTSISSKRVRD